MDEKKTGTIMQIVRLKTELSEEELLKIAKELFLDFAFCINVSGIVRFKCFDYKLNRNILFINISA